MSTTPHIPGLVIPAAPAGTVLNLRSAPGAVHAPPRPTQHADQPVLFEVPDEPEPAAIPYANADPAPVSAALVGDGYGWLRAVLPVPAPIWCVAHRAPMHLTGTANLLFGCGRCDAEGLSTDQAGAAA